MHRDIRSFFTVKKEKKKIEDEGSDVIPESPDIKITNKKKHTRKRRQIQEDSDEEIFSSSKKKHIQQKPALKEVKAVDIFGSAPIKRSEPLVKKPSKVTETGIHSDEEFEKSLLQIDEVDNVVILESPKNENKIDVSIDKPKNINDKHHNSNDVSNDTKKEKIDREKKETGSKKRKLEKIYNHPVVEIKNEKKDFSEFLNDEENANLDEPRQKKIKLEKSFNESVLSDEERHERKRHSAALYQKYLNRSGPKHLGSKQIPKGLPDCLKDCAFLLTGVLDSFERDEIVAAITEFGGCIKSGISKKVTHVLAGDDAGPAKLAKAEELGIKIINEDEFLKMIKGSTENNKTPKEVKKENHVDKINIKEPKQKKHESSNQAENKESKRKESKLSVTSKKEKSASPVKVSNIEKVKSEIKLEAIGNGDSNKSGNMMENSNLMWVDKYKPQTVKQIIGQHGDKSNVKKLTNWLTQWYANRKAKIPKPSPWAKDDNGAYYKAALLSGPPGVGKTTTVSLVCKELGFDMVEFNASDTRSKTLIRGQIGELLSTTSLSAYAKGATGKGAVSKKHVLVMDEVDGMAGNEDRGGLQELISLIKSSSVPVICMCNDRSSEKMRSLLNYCYDLRFERPRVNQIMCAMLSICCKEGVKVPNDVLTQLIEAAGHDVRQTLHMLSVWVVDSQLMDHDRLKREAGRVKKDMKMGPWEAIRRVFSAQEHQGMTINDKSDLFFTDYSIMPLFVQENYLTVVPHGPQKASASKQETLERISRAADSISLGDIVEARIRRNQAWSLLPIQAMYSSVIPGNVLEGHVAGQIQFPGWLGKNSRANKMRRLAQEIHAHTRLSTSGSKSSIFLDYSTHLRDAILDPLIRDKTDGVNQSLQVLESYNLLREDLDSLVELSLWPEKRNPMVLIDPKVKAALTRTYNKTASALPYAPGAVKKGRGIDDNENSQEDAEEVEEDSDPEHDAMIKKKKSKETEKAGPSNASSKGKKSESSTTNKVKKGKSKTTSNKR